MKFLYLLLISLNVCCFTYSGAFAQFQYISPVPNSLYHNPETNIILKTGSEMQQKSLLPELVEISGTKSGLHSFRIVLSADSRTILFYPNEKFMFGETVSVTIKDGFRKKSGEIILGTAFNFSIHPERTPEQLAAMERAAQNIRNEVFGEETSAKDDDGNNGGLLPECTFPEAEIMSTGDEYVASVFARNQRLSDNICFSRHIMSNDGDSIYAFFDEFAGIDFKINLNGYLTFWDKSDSTFVMADSNFNLVKKYQMGNGYRTDEHEFLVYPDGTALLMAYDAQLLDMSVIVTGGNTEAIVTGLVLQELDIDDNVVFEWRSWDHIEITEAVQQVCLTCVEVDYIHGNSIDIDFDNNLLVSNRHLSSIIKIDRSTGEVIWRLGGEKNDFDFVNETGINHFYYQHHFRLLPDGTYSLFNNANFQIPQASGAKIYELDQTAMTATLKWQYVHPTIDGFYLYGRAMGSVQLLPNGNFLIGWGLLSNTNLAPFPNASEVDTAGNVVWEMRYVDSTLVSYRTFKFDFIRCGVIPDSSLQTIFTDADSAKLSWGATNNASSYLFQYKLATAPDWITIELDSNSIELNGLIPQSVYEWRVKSICIAFDDSTDFSEINTFNTIGVSSEGNMLQGISFGLYPNPATQLVFVNTHLKKSMGLTLVISNTLGEMVYEQHWEAAVGSNKFPVSINQLPKGIYTVQLSGSDFLGRQQLVIQ